MNYLKRVRSLRWLAVRHLVVIVLGVGILLRLNHYCGDRPLWLDEATLTLNLIDRSFSGLFQPLAHQQIAPVGFLIIEKLLIQALGASEYVLRLYPLVTGLVSLFLLYQLALRVSGKYVALFSLTLFAISNAAIYYAAEVKQYSSDITIALLLYLCTSFILERWNRKRFIMLTVAGAAAVWFSHPAAFVMAAIGLTLGTYYLIKQDWPKLFYIFASSMVWLASFVVTLLVTSTDDSDVVRSMQVGWTSAFMPLDLSPLTNIKWLADHVLGVFYYPIGLSPVSLAVLLFVVGCFALWKTNKIWLFLLVLPVAITLGASAFHLYPFYGRLLLFLIPGGLLIIANGIESLRWSLWTHHRAAWLILVSVLLVNPLQMTLQAATQDPPYATDTIGTALASIAKSKLEGDHFYLEFRVAPVFRYYHKRFGLNMNDAIYGRRIAWNWDWKTYFEGLRNKLSNEGRVWVVFPHYEPWTSDVLSIQLVFLDQIGTKLRSIETDFASAYLYDFGAAGKTTMPPPSQLKSVATAAPLTH